MPHRVSPEPSPRARVSRSSKARRLLSGKGVAREDSDDELGMEDYAWQWLYDKSSKAKDRQIIGARHGPAFTCQLGDCVLLKSDTANEAWVGLICGFEEDEQTHEKLANFMWFSSEKEIRNKEKKRTDAIPNELYITPAWDWNSLATVNGKAKVLSKKSFDAEYPTGRVPRSSADAGKIFVCRRGCNTRTATYTDEFDWEKVYRGAEDVLDLIDLVKSQTKATRRKRQRGEDSEEQDFKPEQQDELTRTPKKRRFVAGDDFPATGLKTPTKSPTKPSQRTPSSGQKYIIAKKPLEFTPLGTRFLDPTHTTSSPFQVARSRLHVSSVPAALPCREEAFSMVYTHLETAISAGSGTCIYISGTPGTGKTATVREAVAQLGQAVAAEELDDFIFVEINGMKVTEPHQAYSLLWEALRGERVSPSHALDLLEREFNHPSPRRVPCVVLMDELDQLVTKNQGVMYNFFNWPGLANSRLIVLAVANTMDLPERTLSNKISSRLGLTRITFPGYSHEQLQQIIASRLSGVPGALVHPDAIQFAARKVAAVSGDARRALDICRRAVEIAESQATEAEATEADAAVGHAGSDNDGPMASTPSRKRKRGDAEDATERPPAKRAPQVTIATVKQAIQEATSTPLQQHLRALPVAHKLLLAAILARSRRTGAPESVLGDVLDEALKLARMADTPEIGQTLLAGELAGLKGTAPRVLAMGAAARDLSEAGMLGLETRRGERSGKLRLKVSEDEVRLAFKEDADMRGLGLGQG